MIFHIVFSAASVTPALGFPSVSEQTTTARSPKNLHADTVGEIEVEGKVLVIKRIEQTFHLAADEGDRETAERVLEVYADSCPVARSVRESIEITSKLDFTAG